MVSVGCIEYPFQPEETGRNHTGSPQGGAKTKEKKPRPIMLSAAGLLGF